MTSPAPAATSAARSDPYDDGDDILNSLDEIEVAFQRVSNVADSLIDSIRDDSLRAEQRRRSTRLSQKAQQQRKRQTPVVSDDDDDDDDNTLLTMDDDLTLDSHLGHHWDDDSLLLGDDDTVDGSLLGDMKQLRKGTRSLQKELAAEGEAFQANVTNGNERLYFERLQREAEARTPKIKNLNTQPSARLGKRLAAAAKRRNQTGLDVPSLGVTSSSSVVALGPQLKQFCADHFGEKTNVGLAIANLLVWLMLGALLLSGAGSLLDEEGTIVPAMTIIGTNY